MQQEARNTEIQHRHWSNGNLRHRAVNFVSAGEVQRSEFENADREDRTQIETIPSTQDQEIERSPEKTEPALETMFYFDSTRQTTTETGFPDPVPPPELLDSDDPSEDEVVFTGRNKSAKPVIIETTSDELQRTLSIVPPKQPATPTTTSEMEQVKNRDPQLGIDQRHARPPTRQKIPVPDESDPLADYIANIDHDYCEEEEEDNTTCYTQIEPGGIEVGSTSASSKAPRSSSVDSPTRRHGNTVPEENEVQSSIDGKRPPPSI